MAGSKPAALPLGDTPTEAARARVSYSTPARRISSSDPALERQGRAHPPRVANAANMHEPVPVKRARRRLRKPLERLRHFRIARPHHRLAIVAAARFEKAAYCDEGGISCQFRGLEYLGGADGDARTNNEIPARRQRNGC